jgi:hypothetical protein
LSRTLALVLTVLLVSPRGARAEEGEPASETTFTWRHRYAYAGSAAFLIGGLVAGYVAQQDSANAKTATTATATHSAILGAQNASGTANLLYILAGVTLVYGLLFEFLPRSVTDRATLTFHF